MPHPLKRWTPTIHFTPNAVELRPDLAIAIARISADWAQVEWEVGKLLATILDTEFRTGVAMYLALMGSAAQEAALTAAASKMLSEDRQDELTTLLRDVRARSRERNRMIHCLWGTSPEFPTDLINCPLDQMVSANVEAAHMRKLTGQKAGLPPEFLESLRLYKPACFRDIQKRLRTTRLALCHFRRRF